MTKDNQLITQPDGFRYTFKMSKDEIPSFKNQKQQSYSTLLTLYLRATLEIIKNEQMLHNGKEQFNVKYGNIYVDDDESVNANFLFNNKKEVDYFKSIFNTIVEEYCKSIDRNSDIDIHYFRSTVINTQLKINVFSSSNELKKSKI